jgi:L-2-amino-thiazoline-4-carboxylic acid hydrolase
MRRRTTLALVAGGAAAAAAGGAIVGGRLRFNRLEHDAPSPEDRTMDAESWYLQNKPKIMREVRLALRHFRKHLVETYGKEEGEAIASETMQGFEALLPDLPYIGGDENTLTRNLYLTAAMLAMYRALQARGASVEQAARLIYLGTASFFNSVPTRWLLRWQGRRVVDRTFQDQRRHVAAISQQRRYPDDWVFEVVDGDGQGFAFGVDYTECGIVKYLAREGAPELAPYLCWIDYPQFAAMHVRLDRTETLAQGGRRCDFRMSRGEPVKVEPEFLYV